MDIISIIQNHYRVESTISISATIEDVRKTFVALSRTGLYIQTQCWKSSVRCNSKIIEVDWARQLGEGSIRLLTEITIEQQLDRNSTTLNLTTRISREELVDTIIQVFVAEITLVCIININTNLDYRYTSCIVIFYITIQAISMYFAMSPDLLVKHFQKYQVWNGLGSKKPPINNPWFWRENK